MTEGHPDKICDQISDSVLDALLTEDQNSRVACETAVNTGLVLVMGEISTNAYVDIQKIVRSRIREIGFVNSAMGFDADSCGIIVSLDEQSPDIALGVDRSLEAKTGGENGVGAGDQGMMFGYACNETSSYMPLPISMAHALARRLAAARKEGTLDFLYPDGKTQVTVQYDGEKPVRIDTVVVSSQHNAEVEMDTLREGIIEEVIRKTIPEGLIDRNTKLYVNPTGRFVVGGPKGDSGLTGRKIIVDTYGGMARHGGGAFSGKDPTKVDRSAAYAARYVAKNLVAAGIADRCEIEVAYAIGVARPVSLFVETFGTGRLPDDAIVKLIDQNFDLRPQAIIERLQLRRPIYAQVAAYGHFGRNDLDLPWEKLDLAEKFKAAL